MEDRYARAEQVTGRLTAEALAALVGREAPWDAEPARPEHVSLVNALPVARRALVRIPMPPGLAAEPSLVADRPAGTLAAQAGDGGTLLVAVDLPAWGATT